MRYAHFAEICERRGNKRNMRLSHIPQKLTCLAEALSIMSTRFSTSTACCALANWVKKYLQRAGMSHPQKEPFLVGIPWPPSNTRFPGPAWAHIPNGISVGSAVFVGFAVASSRQTHALTTLHLQQQAASCAVCIASFGVDSRAAPSLPALGP